MRVTKIQDLLRQAINLREQLDNLITALSVESEYTRQGKEDPSIADARHACQEFDALIQAIACEDLEADCHG